jgi:hypothetical protein
VVQTNIVADAKPDTVDGPATRPRCGVVMPISATDGCSEHHWSEVQAIIFDAVTTAGFDPNLVSDADDVGIIHKRIVENLYSNPMIVCDVSGKNPNVMFELGLRLAFDKPTIIVKDDKTSYSFDTGQIEHLPYPRDLRYAAINTFKSLLAAKVVATFQASLNDPKRTTFLGHFGSYTVAKIPEREVSRDEALTEELSEIRAMLRTLLRRERRLVAGPRASQDLPATGHRTRRKAMVEIMREVFRTAAYKVSDFEAARELMTMETKALFPEASDDEITAAMDEFLHTP